MRVAEKFANIPNSLSGPIRLVLFRCGKNPDGLIGATPSPVPMDLAVSLAANNFADSIDTDLGGLPVLENESL